MTDKYEMLELKLARRHMSDVTDCRPNHLNKKMATILFGPWLETRGANITLYGDNMYVIGNTFMYHVFTMDGKWVYSSGPEWDLL